PLDARRSLDLQPAAVPRRARLRALEHHRHRAALLPLRRRCRLAGAAGDLPPAVLRRGRRRRPARGIPLLLPQPARGVAPAPRTAPARDACRAGRADHRGAAPRFGGGAAARRRLSVRERRVRSLSSRRLVPARPRTGSREMTFDAWWLLAIPLFFVLGWFAARFDARQSRASGGMPDAYFRGLNFLLNEQPDKAIDAFIDVVQVDPETIELHFALGDLFRRRGETDRALRVPPDLIERRDLDAEQREHALFELGQDFLRAGLIDRAEDAFNRLEGSRYRAAALHHRLQIAQMVRDWPQAISIAERLRLDLGENRSHELAQFHCERAAAALAADGADAPKAAMDAIALATEADPMHPRPWLMRGELALRDDKPAQALDAWERMLELSPAHASLIAVSWLEASRRADRLD